MEKIKIRLRLESEYNFYHIAPCFIGMLVLLFTITALFFMFVSWDTYGKLGGTLRGGALGVILLLPILKIKKQ